MVDGVGFLSYGASDEVVGLKGGVDRHEVCRAAEGAGAGGARKSAKTVKDRRRPFRPI